MGLHEFRVLVAMIAVVGAVMLPVRGRAAGAADDAFAERVVPPRSITDLVLQATDGKPIRLADFRGKVVVIGFLITN